MVNYQMFFFLLLGLLALSAKANRLCYFPDHSVAVNDTACTANSVSVCCQQGAACLENGLCYLPSASAVGGFIRGSCTDQTWASPDCPQYCTEDILGGIYNSLSDAGVLSCGSSKFCCESDSVATCDCQTGNGTFTLSGSISAFITISSSTTASSTTTSSSSTTSSSTTTTSSTTTSLSTSSSSATSSTSAPTPSTTTSASPPSSSLLSEGAKIGIGVGVSLGFALLAVTAIFLWRERRNKHRISNLQQPKNMPSSGNKPAAWNLPTQSGPHELYPMERSGANMYELPGR